MSSVVNGIVSYVHKLPNLTSSCYLNALMQLLVQVPEVVEYFNEQDPPAGESTISLSIAMKRFFCAISLTNAKAVTTEHKNLLTTIIQTSKGQFKSNFHEDPSELFDWVLERLTKERPEGTFASFKDLFKIQLNTGLRCLVCSDRMYSVASHTYMSVPIPSKSKKRSTIDACLLECFTESPYDCNGIERMCSYCNHVSECMHTLDIAQTSKVVTIVFPRFDGLTRVKNDIFIEIPLLFTSQVLLDKSYDLVGFIAHHGPSLAYGHFTTVIKDPENSSWIEVNDNLPVKFIEDSNQLWGQAYMAMYRLIKGTIKS